MYNFDELYNMEAFKISEYYFTKLDISKKHKCVLRELIYLTFMYIDDMSIKGIINFFEDITSVEGYINTINNDDRYLFYMINTDIVNSNNEKETYQTCIDLIKKHITKDSIKEYKEFKDNMEYLFNIAQDIFEKKDVEINNDKVKDSIKYLNKYIDNEFLEELKKTIDDKECNMNIVDNCIFKTYQFNTMKSDILFISSDNLDNLKKTKLSDIEKNYLNTHVRTSQVIKMVIYIFLSLLIFIAVYMILKNVIMNNTILYGLPVVFVIFLFILMYKVIHSNDNTSDINPTGGYGYIYDISPDGEEKEKYEIYIPTCNTKVRTTSDDALYNDINIKDVVHVIDIDEDILFDKISD